MSSGPAPVTTQLSIKDKRRRLVRQHATEEDYHIPLESHLLETNFKSADASEIFPVAEKGQIQEDLRNPKKNDTRKSIDKEDR